MARFSAIPDAEWRLSFASWQRYGDFNIISNRSQQENEQKEFGAEKGSAPPSEQDGVTGRARQSKPVDKLRRTFLAPSVPLTTGLKFCLVRSVYSGQA